MKINLKPVIIKVFGTESHSGRLGDSHNHLDISSVNSSRARLTGFQTLPERTDFKSSDELGVVGVERADQFHVTHQSYVPNWSNVSVVSPSDERR